jgi:UPF0271 protein
MRVDLNADVGESYGAYVVGDDDALFASLTSASVAAGFHAGDPRVLRRTIRLARQHGVSIGAHPGFPDLAGFGRREMHLSTDDAEDMVLYQIAAVAGVAQSEGVRLQHVKPHGALYNMAAADPGLAAAIARAVRAFDASLILYGLPGSALLEAGRAAGLRVAAEAFADRAYQRDGTLAPRSMSRSVITEASAVVPRAIRMVAEGVVTAIDGTTVPIAAETLCVHGDTPGAGKLAASLRSGLEAAGITVASFQSGPEGPHETRRADL